MPPLQPSLQAWLGSQFLLPCPRPKPHFPLPGNFCQEEEELISPLYPSSERRFQTNREMKVSLYCRSAGLADIKEALEIGTGTYLLQETCPGPEDTAKPKKPCKQAETAAHIRAEPKNTTFEKSFNL